WVLLHRDYETDQQSDDSQHDPDDAFDDEEQNAHNPPTPDPEQQQQHPGPGHAQSQHAGGRPHAQHQRQSQSSSMVDEGAETEEEEEGPGEGKDGEVSDDDREAKAQQPRVFNLEEWKPYFEGFEAKLKAGITPLGMSSRCWHRSMLH